MKPAKWFTLTIAAIGFWGLYGVAFKLASDRLAALPAQIFSSLGLLTPVLFLIPAVLRERERKGGLWIGLISGICGAAGNLALLAALREGKVAIVVPLTALYPLITVVVAILFMRERARPVQGLGMALAISAVVLLSVEPGTSFSTLQRGLSFAPWLLYAIGALVAFGLAGVFQKLATNRVSAETAFAMFAVGFIPLSLTIFFLERWPTHLPTAPVMWAVAGGLLNGFGVLATLAAFRSGGKAAIVTPLAALYPVITVIIAMIFLHEKLNAVQCAGIALAIVGALFLARE